MFSGTRIITFCFILLTGTERLISSTVRYELDLHDSSSVQFGYPLEAHQTPMTDVSKPLLGDQTLPEGSQILVEWYIRNLATEQLTLAVENSSLACTSAYLLISEATETAGGFEPREARDVLQCGKVVSRVNELGLNDFQQQINNVEALREARENHSGTVVYEEGGRMISDAPVLVVRLICISQTSQCQGQQVTLTATAEARWTLSKQCINFWAVNLTSKSTVTVHYPTSLNQSEEYAIPDEPENFPHEFTYNFQKLSWKAADCWHVSYDIEPSKTVILELISLDLPCASGHLVLEQKSVYFSRDDSHHERLDTFNMCGDGDLELLVGRGCASNMSDLYIYPVFKSGTGWENINFTLKMEVVDSQLGDTDFPHCNNYSLTNPDPTGDVEEFTLMEKMAITVVTFIVCNLCGTALGGAYIYFEERFSNWSCDCNLRNQNPNMIPPNPDPNAVPNQNPSSVQNLSSSPDTVPMRDPDQVGTVELIPDPGFDRFIDSDGRPYLGNIQPQPDQVLNPGVPADPADTDGCASTSDDPMVSRSPAQSHHSGTQTSPTLPEALPMMHRCADTKESEERD